MLARHVTWLRLLAVPDACCVAGSQLDFAVLRGTTSATSTAVHTCWACLHRFNTVQQLAPQGLVGYIVPLFVNLGGHSSRSHQQQHTTLALPCHL
jgi:hypothetical protein